MSNKMNEVVTKGKLYILGDITGELGDKKTKSIMTDLLRVSEKEDDFNIIKITDVEPGVLTVHIKFQPEPNEPEAKILRHKTSEICKRMGSKFKELCIDKVKRDKVINVEGLSVEEVEKIVHIMITNSQKFLPNKKLGEITFYF